MSNWDEINEESVRLFRSGSKAAFEQALDATQQTMDKLVDVLRMGAVA
jgi:hypothetical protein